MGRQALPDGPYVGPVGPSDSAEPVTVGVIGLADTGIGGMFPAVSEGILFPPDPTGMLFPADLAELVTVGVADLADAGILFPAVSEGIPFPTDPGLGSYCLQLTTLSRAPWV